MARAVLFMYNPKTGQTSTDVFETPDFENPVRTAENLKASCEEDFPEAIWSIGADHDARVLIGELRTREMLGSE